MSFRRLMAGFGWAAALASAAVAQERNAWPFWVSVNAGAHPTWNAVGPLLYSEPVPDGGQVSGLRPLYQHFQSRGWGPEEWTYLYPIFTYRSYHDWHSWSVFQLVRNYSSGGRAGTAPGEPKVVQVWPFYFAQTGGPPGTDYRALLPFGGTVKDFAWFDRLTFVAFPLYVQIEHHGAVTTSTPWPIVRVTRGAEHGFAFWPFYVADDRPGAFSRRFYLWPLIWNATTEPPPDAPKGTAPSTSHGFLPFYAAVRGPAVTSVDYFWPFFGYTDDRGPQPYHETRYFWPFLVQGRGPVEYRNRWGPFYTHSVVNGTDKVWSPFPVLKRQHWQDGALDDSITQVLYFLYWRGEERLATRPTAPPAYKEHIWPFVSVWDNGAGDREWEALSPFEVFFPNNREVRAGWTPFFAVIRHHRQADGSTRTSLLWNAVTWERHPRDGTSEFHLGPLLTVRRNADGRKTWRLFAMEFSHRSPTVRVADRKP